MSAPTLSSLVAHQHMEDPVAADLLGAFAGPDGMTMELLEARARRQFSTLPGGKRLAIVIRAWELHVSRCQLAEAEADPSVIALPTAAPESVPRKEKPRKTATRPRAPRPVEWGGIQVLPVPGDPDKARLIVDRTLDREWALRLASMACNVFAEVQ